MTKLRLSFLILFCVSCSFIVAHVMYVNKYTWRETSIHIFQKINLIGSGMKIDKPEDKNGGSSGASSGQHDPNEKDQTVVEKPSEKAAQIPNVDSTYEKPVKPEVTTVASGHGEKTPSLPSTTSNKEGPQDPVKDVVKSSGKNVFDDGELDICPKSGRALVGLMYVDQTVPKMEDLEKQMSVLQGGTVEKGGSWKPTDCKPRAKTAIIIPYRNREEQLKIFLRHLHPILQRQLLEYRIIVVEQTSTWDSYALYIEKFLPQEDPD